MQKVFQGAKANDIFDIIWSKPTFRTSLFGNRLENDAENYFNNTLVPSTGSLLYNFIIIN